MAEREQGAERRLDGERNEAMPIDMAPPTVAVDDAEDERHRRVMASAERVMRKHRNVLAALAESERRDREADTGSANVRRGMA